MELAEQLATQEGRTVREAQQQADASRNRHNAARELLAIEDYSAIDVHRWSEEVTRLQAEYELLDRNSEPLRVPAIALARQDCVRLLLGREGRQRKAGYHRQLERRALSNT